MCLRYYVRWKQKEWKSKLCADIPVLSAHPKIQNLIFDSGIIPQLLGTGIAVRVVDFDHTVHIVGHHDKVARGCKISGAHDADDWIPGFQIPDDSFFIQRNLRHI